MKEQKEEEIEHQREEGEVHKSLSAFDGNGYRPLREHRAKNTMVQGNEKKQDFQFRSLKFQMLFVFLSHWGTIFLHEKEDLENWKSTYEQEERTHIRIRSSGVWDLDKELQSEILAEYKEDRDG